MGTSTSSGALDRRAEAARRQASRARRMLRTTLVAPDGSVVECVVSDLSATGAGLICLATLEAGAAIVLDLPGLGAVHGKVAWAAGVRIGVAFTGRIEPAAVATPAAHAPR